MSCAELEIPIVLNCSLCKTGKIIEGTRLFRMCDVCLIPLIRDILAVDYRYELIKQSMATVSLDLPSLMKVELLT